MTNYEEVGYLYEQFERQATATPEKIAVVDVNSNETITYKKLDETTHKLARVLQSHGVRENTIVVIYMDKCAQYVIGYISILRAGGAYLPLDISYPSTLIKEVLMESEPITILTKSELAASLNLHLTNQSNVNVICLDDQKFFPQIETLAVDAPEYQTPVLSMDSLAFVVYSSGTTGKPKGICVPQRAPILSYQWRHDNYPYEGDENEAANVFFIWELFRPLLKGQTLYIIPDDVIYDPKKLLEFLSNNRINRMLFTPSLLEAVLDYKQDAVADGFRYMKQVWLCGEVTTATLIKRAMDTLAHVKFINLYSVSECHDVTAVDLTELYKENPQLLTKSKFAPVGKLLPFAKVAILDNDLQLQPVGVPGEIYVVGPSLALGYLKRPDLTKKKFLPLTSQFKASDVLAGEKMYKTGDWGYILSDGSLEICGRCDEMVKVRGYSVELSAIENTIVGLNYIHSCVVLIHGEEGEDKMLIAYIVVAPNHSTVTIKTIRGDLKRRLPFYMIPSYFVFLKEIPIVAGSGKLDKNALPDLNKAEHQCRPEYLPETETEKILAKIWTSVLQLPSIDVQESFFDLGGHSLLAAKLLHIVNDRFNSNLTVKDLYNSPTLVGMGKLLDRQSPDREPELNLQQEVTVHCQYSVDFDIHLRAFWRFSSYNKKRWQKGYVLLTGSTGYLGAFLLWELLTKTESHIFCLIREGSKGKNPGEVVEIKNRLLDTLRYYHILPTEEEQSEETTSMINQRVTCVKGDVSLTNFGLSEDDYLYLSTEIDIIIHAAAYVNLIYPYSALYSSNVLGTCNVIKFASNLKLKPLHYVSTDAVFPDDMIGSEHADLTGVWKRLTNGYSQSKWVAEQIVIKAMNRGHPVVVYRLGNQGADRINGAVNREDFNFMMIRSFTELGCCPDMDWLIEMTPVDFTASFIVNCAVSSLSSNVGKVYHLINNKPLLLRTLQHWMSVHGYRCDLVSYEDYLDRLKGSKVDYITKLYSMLSEVAKTEEYFTKLPIHDSKRTQEITKSLGMAYPQINNALLTLYFTKLIENGLIAKPKSCIPTVTLHEESNISGKVAVITGASSGIGEETALLLAQHNCSVALLARREDKLKQLQQMISSLGGTALYIKADVTKEKDIENAMNMIETVLGPVDILVNCAGLMYYQRSQQPDIVKCNSMIEVNVKGVMLCVSKFLPGMISRNKGHIVNISSDAGVRGFPGLAVYSGTKFFVEGYSQAVRQEMIKYNIRVTCIQPGDVRTPLQDSSLVDDEAVKEFYTGSDSSKMLEPKDVAKSILFVVSSPDYMAINTLLVEPTSAPI